MILKTKEARNTVEIIGNRFENLEDLNRKKNEIKQWTAEELEEKIEDYKRKVRDEAWQRNQSIIKPLNKSLKNGGSPCQSNVLTAK